MRVGYAYAISWTASMVPEQRSCWRTSCGWKEFFASSLFGLMHRMKCALVMLRSSSRPFRSLMKRRETELKCEPLAPRPEVRSRGSKRPATIESDEFERREVKSRWSVSLFLSRKPEPR